MRRALVSLTYLFALACFGQSSAQTFNDVPTDYWAYAFIETFTANGFSAGCGNGNYCPEDSVTRAQMAVFLERGMNGASFVPPAATGNAFLDVGAEDFAANFIEQLFNDGVTAGCGNSNFCPGADVSRAQMAVFLLRAKYGSDYSPPPASGVFDDVDTSYWAVHWIEQLSAEGITSGCGNGSYCPENAVTRAQMAVFMVRTFGLELPCPSFGGFCFAVESGVIRDFQDAEQTCANLYGGHLASVHSQQEDDFISALVDPTGVGDITAWIGGFATLGFREGAGGTYQWTDGSPWDFSNWRITTGEPNATPAGAPGGIQFWPYTNGNLSGWNDVPQDELTISNIVCKYPE